MSPNDIEIPDDPPASGGSPADNLPKGFVDALIGYALDPTQWQRVAQELDRRDSTLAAMEPGAFLSLLSRAESLAFQFRAAPEEVRTQIQCPFVLLDRDMRCVSASDNFALIAHYARVDDRDALLFHDADTATQFDQAMESLRNGERTSMLIELRGADRQPRYAYLVEAEYLPATLKHLAPTANSGLLVAEANPGDRVRNLVQSSFNLTSAETAVAMHLSAGLVLKQIAAALNISTNTARNHLQSIFDKTNVNRQTDLILMLTQLNVLVSVISAPAHTDPPSRGIHPGHRFIVAPAEDGRGRRVAYRQYGTGNTAIAYFHETVASSRLLPHTAELATALGLTVISPERPGSGFSDPLATYDFATTAGDVALLLDELGIDKVRLLGFMSGAAHALATASILGERVEHLLIVAGRGASGYPTEDKGALAVLRRRLLQQPWILSTFFNILRSRANPGTNARLLQTVYGSVPHDAALLVQRPDILEHIIGASLECMTVSANGIVGELGCFAAPAPLRLQDIVAPITVWHGSDDQVAPLAALRESLGGIQYDERIFPGHGSLVLYEHWEEALTYLATA